MLHEGYGGANQPSTSRSHIQIYSARNKTGSNDAIQLDGKVSRNSMNMIKNNSSSNRNLNEDESIVVGGRIASGNSSNNHL